MLICVNNQTIEWPPKTSNREKLVTLTAITEATGGLSYPIRKGTLTRALRFYPNQFHSSAMNNIVSQLSARVVLNMSSKGQGQSSIINQRLPRVNHSSHLPEQSNIILETNSITKITKKYPRTKPKAGGQTRRPLCPLCYRDQQEPDTSSQTVGPDMSPAYLQNISVNKTYFQCNLNVLILKFKMHFLNSAIFERLNCFVNEF